MEKSLQFEKGKIYNIKYTKKICGRYSRLTGMVASYIEREMKGEYEFIGKRKGKLYFYGIWNGDDAFLDLAQIKLIESE